MRYRDIKPQPAPSIANVTPQQLAAQDAQSMPVKSDQQLHGEVQRKMAVDIAQDAQQKTVPTSFDKMMAFRRYCMTQNAANKVTQEQIKNAQDRIRARRSN